MNQKKPDAEINAAIRNACKNSFGVLDTNFLCQSLGIFNLKSPVYVRSGDSLHKVISLLKEKKIGCVLVLDNNDKLKGIFSERDCVLKIFGTDIDLKTAPVDDFMTKDPVTATPDITIAYALNLMSQGGFRHLPVVDETGMAVSMVSSKDVIDHIVDSFTNDLLDFQTFEGIQE